ncbi:hypothetical protein OL548_13245 [Lysinibacillus sp. MHQ-1]|nr:hypothetical protein OL548_13245 [Lysinibacillus sp. MHQ-1]
MDFLLFFWGMSKLKGQSIAILSYIDPLTSLVISTMFIGEKNDATTTNRSDTIIRVNIAK